MTTLDEYLRAIRWGREFLVEMVANTEATAAFRALASEALGNYPAEHQVAYFLRSSAQELERWEGALAHTSLLLTMAASQPGASAERKYQIKVIQRHFPLAPCITSAVAVLHWLERSGNASGLFNGDAEGVRGWPR